MSNAANTVTAPDSHLAVSPVLFTGTLAECFAYAERMNKGGRDAWVLHPNGQLACSFYV